MSSVRGSQRGIKYKCFLNKESEWREMEMCSETRDQSGEKQNMEMSEWKNEMN
jgi:hypothetical protein